MDIALCYESVLPARGGGHDCVSFRIIGGKKR